MFTVYKVNLDNSLSHKEHLDSVDELNLWIGEKHGQFATIKIVREKTKYYVIMTDNGTWFEKIKSKEM